MRKKIRMNKKGSIIVATLGFIVMAISFLAFSWDIARLMYYRTYVRSLASTVALSMVHECSYPYHDTNNDVRVVLIYDGMTDVPTDYGNRRKAGVSYAKEIINKNISGADRSFSVEKVLVNPDISPTGVVRTNYDRFIIGSDGINGEVEVHIIGKVDMSFSFMGGHSILKGTAVAQPTGTVTTQQYQERDEQKLQFDIWNY